MVIALVGLIFILLLVFVLIIRGQSKKYAKKSDSGERRGSVLLGWGRGWAPTGDLGGGCLGCRRNEMPVGWGGSMLGILGPMGCQLGVQSPDAISLPRASLPAFGVQMGH